MVCSYGARREESGVVYRGSIWEDYLGKYRAEILPKYGNDKLVYFHSALWEDGVLNYNFFVGAIDLRTHEMLPENKD